MATKEPVSAPHTLAGKRLRPVLEDPAHPHKEATFALVTRGPQRFGQSVCTTRRRFRQWSHGATLLYDHTAGAEEPNDVTSDPASAPAVADLKRRIQSPPPRPIPCAQ